MRLTPTILLSVIAVFAALPCSVDACILCGNLKDRQSIRDELKQAKLVIYGKIVRSDLSSSNGLASGRGTSTLRIIKVLKSHPGFDKRETIEIDRYIPVLDAKNPPKFIVFFDVTKSGLDAYHGRPAATADMLVYLAGAQKRQDMPRIKALPFFFQYLAHKDPEISGDAFLEFAKATDAEVGEMAKTLASADIRRLLVNPDTPAERIGLFAFLLGAAGNAEDAELLRSMIKQPTARTRNALDGLLSGFIQLQPEAGWDQVVAVLSDPKRGFTQRYAAARVLSFYQSWKPKESRPQIIRAMRVMLKDGAIADLAVNDLRRWQRWDLTDEVLICYEKKSHQSPVTQRAIIRYALCCPQPSAREFVKSLRSQDPQLVAEVEQSLEFEKKKS